MENNLKGLEEKLCYNFLDKSLLINALCHKSYINEARGRNITSYERLEFLGDSVLGLVVSRYIFDNFKTFPEGKLSKLRASVVCEETLSQVAKKLGIGKYIIFSKGEKSDGGENKPGVLCDVTEAIIAAIYLDSGFDNAKAFILRNLKDIIDSYGSEKMDSADYKSLFQELVQQNGGEISYKILSEKGPDHLKEYEAGVYVNGELIAKGIGTSKKKAEMSSACEALNVITHKKKNI